MFQCWHVANDIPLASQAQAVSTHHSPAIKHSALIGSSMNRILFYDWSKFTQRLNQWLLVDTLELIQRIYLLNTFIIGLGCTWSSWRRSVFLTPDNTLVSLVDSLLINTCVFQSRASCQHMFQTSDLSLHTHKHRVLPRKSLQHTRNCRSCSQYSQSQADTRPSL